MYRDLLIRSPASNCQKQPKFKIMKIKSIFLLTIFFAVFTGFQSCSDDDSGSDDDTAGCANFEAEYEDVTTALTAFSENQTTANCEAYKNALLDFYADFNDCPYWGDYYQEAYEQIQAMDCSGLETN